MEKGSSPQLHTLVGDVHQSLCRAQQQGPDLLLQQGAPSSLQHFSQSHKCAAHPALIPSMHLGIRSTGSTITRRQLHLHPWGHTWRHTEVKVASWQQPLFSCLGSSVWLLLASAFITGLGVTWWQSWGHQRIPVRAQHCLLDGDKVYPWASQRCSIHRKHILTVISLTDNQVSINTNNALRLFNIQVIYFDYFIWENLLQTFRYKQAHQAAFTLPLRLSPGHKNI